MAEATLYYNCMGSCARKELIVCLLTRHARPLSATAFQPLHMNPRHPLCLGDRLRLEESPRSIIVIIIAIITFILPYCDDRDDNTMEGRATQMVL